jgi:hypothetical protein
MVYISLKQNVKNDAEMSLLCNVCRVNSMLELTGYQKNALIIISYIKGSEGKKLVFNLLNDHSTS